MGVSYVGCGPPPRMPVTSHHQDSYMFSRGSVWIFTCHCYWDTQLIFASWINFVVGNSLELLFSHTHRGTIFWWNDGEVWSYWSSLLDNGNLKVCWNRDKPCQLPNGTFCIAQDGCFNGINTTHLGSHCFLLKTSNLWVPNFEAYYGDKPRGLLHLQQHMRASLKSSSSKFKHAKVAKIHQDLLGLGRMIFFDIFCGKTSFWN